MSKVSSIVFQGESLARLLREAILELCGELKHEVVSVVDALAPTDFVLNSVLGKSDGNVSILLDITSLLTSRNN